MPTPLYCWRCDAVIPMLDDAEWDVMAPQLDKTSHQVKHLRKTERLDLAGATQRASGEVLELWFQLTGHRETNWHAIYHHQLRLFGPPCLACGRPLRTPLAKHCAACGALR